MRTFILAITAAGTLLACKGGDTTGAASSTDCATSSSSGGSSGLSAFEQGLVGPLLTDVREGVQPWSEQSIGICKGQGRDCEEFIGTNAEDLPPGEYMMRAELKVPRVGDKGTWRVKFEAQCTTTRKTASGETTTTSTTSKEYDVQYAGTERGSRLSPLFTIRSPDPSGEKHCNYKVTSLHPDKPSEWTGSWSVPQG
ncbi:hypothetical protein F0U60_28090 [Archangium minus]|uniref:Lipoprotein n=1 Tax=Archangium minus TaxID=83450 RepID=A0ABY9WWM6_9BACT|nr:hypothetical protein F0U61_28245 [Archangium violaceum]WNG47550.1 hypothetical protein F0U60_28090 [Archangium minus]